MCHFLAALNRGVKIEIATRAGFSRSMKATMSSTEISCTLGSKKDIYLFMDFSCARESVKQHG